ncbi:MAG: ketoacyl-ACP synthase III [Phascolarctobacterium sp.]|nr:ketoacyl-ACP synthase III [Candidatus Phascolarctobacterium equi]
MDILTVDGVKIAGVVACLPENLVDNREACSDLYGKEVGTLIKATGIEKRALANPGTTALDLGVTAAKRLLQQTGTEPDEVGAVLCVTFTPEYIMPADAPSAQARLGLLNNCVAFDVNMACSGYGYGLHLGAMLCKQLQKKVLVLDGDIQSAFCSQLDKATMPVMADIGTATLLQPCEGANKWSFSFYTDGTKRNVLYIPAGGSKQPSTENDVKYHMYDDGSQRKNTDIYMDGYGVFMFVALKASKFIAEFMEEKAMTVDDLDAFVPHQANIYVITQLAKKLKFANEKAWKSGDIYGNPGSSSVPLTIAKNANEWFNSGKCGNILFSGFGGGLSISVGLIDLNKDGYYEVIKYGE